MLIGLSLLGEILRCGGQRCCKQGCGGGQQAKAFAEHGGLLEDEGMAKIWVTRMLTPQVAFWATCLPLDAG